MSLLTALFIFCSINVTAQTPIEITKQGIEQYNAKEYGKALELFKQASSQDEPNAKYFLGLMAISGMLDGVTPETGWSLIEDAANQGVAQAQIALGKHGVTGEDVDYNKFMKDYVCFRKAAAAGDTEAAGYVAQMDNIIMSSVFFKYDYVLELCNLEEYEMAFEWFQKIAGNNVQEQYDLGWMYFAGVGTEKDLSKAEEWFLKSAEGGSSRAMWFLAKQYGSFGNYFRMDTAEFVKWQKKAQERGYSEEVFMYDYQHSWISKVPQKYIK